MVLGAWFMSMRGGIDCGGAGNAENAVEWWLASNLMNPEGSPILSHGSAECGEGYPWCVGGRLLPRSGRPIAVKVRVGEIAM